MSMSVPPPMSVPPEIRVLNTSTNLFRAAAEEFAAIARAAVADRGQFTVALAGGSTPRGLYSLLASDYRDSLPWKQTFCFWNDERHVPPADPASNFNMTQEALLSNVAVPPQNVFRILAENADAGAAALAYEQTLRDFFASAPGQFPRFDLILLGMGPDGHTASLFPGTAGLQQHERLVIANWVEKFQTDRITFTFPLLNAAAEVIFLVSGPDKAEMLPQVLGPPMQPPLPAQLVSPADGRLLWMVDRAAAGNALESSPAKH